MTNLDSMFEQRFYGKTNGISALFTILIACFWPSLSSIGLSSCSAFSEGQVILSSNDGTYLLADQTPIPLERSPEGISGTTIDINVSEKRQSVLGLGASLEHATCENLFKLAPNERDLSVEKLVSPDRGIGMNLMRICIGTSDFVGEPYYTYNDFPDGETDPNLVHFSIEKARRYVLPIIKLALQKSPERLIFASPWSPPAWMKDSGEFGGGSLKAEHYPARSYNAWVIMLDEHRQPNRGPHSASATCVELLDDGSVRYNFDYFMQGQFM